MSGDSFYMQDGKAVFPLGTLTVEETKAPNGYLLEMCIRDSVEETLKEMGESTWLS